METLPPLLLTLPLVAAALTRVPAVWGRAWLSGAVAIVSCATVAVMGAVLAVAGRETPVVHWVGGWEPRDGTAIGVALVADGLSAGFVAFAAASVTLALWHALGSYERTGGMLEVMTLLLLAAFTGFVLSADLFSMFVFIELLGITVYVLTASKIEDRAAVPAAVNVAVTSTIGAVLFLTGAALVYGSVGTPNLALVGERLAAAPVTPTAAVGVGLLAAGLAVKAGLVPFHFGHLDSHTAARVPHAGLFGAVTVPAGLYGLARLQTAVVPGLGDGADLQPLLLGAALLTALVGGFLAVCQTHLKRLLACSSLAHIGIAATGIAIAGAEGLTGSAIYLASHGALKLGLFLAVGVMLHRLGSVEVEALVGRGREARVAAWCLTLGGPLLAGVPPAGLFVGKASIVEAASAVGLGWVVPVLYLSAGLTGAALVRVAFHLWGGWPLAPDRIGHIGEGSRETVDADVPAGFFSAPVLLLVASVAMVGVPGLLDGVAAATASFADAGVLRGASSVGSGRSPVSEGQRTAGLDVWTASSLSWAAAAFVLAVLVGAILARRGRAEPVPTYARPIVLLRTLHSGHVGDYAAWATLGAGVCCGWVLLGQAPWP